MTKSEVRQHNLRQGWDYRIYPHSRDVRELIMQRVTSKLLLEEGQNNDFNHIKKGWGPTLKVGIMANTLIKDSL